MLFACGASGNVVGHWKVYSTSLTDVQLELEQLAAREQARGQVRRMMQCLRQFGGGGRRS